MGSVDTAMMGFVTSAAKSYVKGRRAKQKMRSSSSPRHSRRTNDEANRQSTVNSSSLQDKPYPSTTVTTSTSATGLGGTDIKRSTSNSPALIFRQTKSPLRNHKSLTSFGQSPLRDGPTPRFPIPSLSALTPDKSFMSQTGSSHHSGTGLMRPKNQQGSPSGTSSGSPRTAPSHGSLLLTPSTTTTSNYPALERYKTNDHKELHKSAPATVAHLIRPVPPPAKQGSQKTDQTRNVSIARAQQLSREVGISVAATTVRAKSSTPNEFATLTNSGSNLQASTPQRPAPSREANKDTHLAASPLAVYSVLDSTTWRHSSSMPASLNAPSLPPTTPRVSAPFMHTISSGGMISHEPLPIVREGPSSIIREATTHLTPTKTAAAAMSLPSHPVQRDTQQNVHRSPTTVLTGPQIVDRSYVMPSSLPPSTAVVMHRQVSSPIMLLQPPRHFTTTQNPYEPLEQAIPVLQHHISTPVDVVYEAQVRNQQMSPSRPVHSGGILGDTGPAQHPMMSQQGVSDDEVSLRDLVLRYQPPVERGEFEGLPEIPRIVGRNKKPMKLPRNLELDSFSGYIVPSESAKFGIKARRNNPFCVQC